MLNAGAEVSVKRGQVLKMTPEVRQAILDWAKAKRELGTQSTLAARLGISSGYVEKILAEERYREQGYQ